MQLKPLWSAACACLAFTAFSGAGCLDANCQLVCEENVIAADNPFEADQVERTCMEVCHDPPASGGFTSDGLGGAGAGDGGFFTGFGGDGAGGRELGGNGGTGGERFGGAAPGGGGAGGAAEQGGADGAGGGVATSTAGVGGGT